MTRMKESGIDWIGQIPEEWELGKVKFFQKISAGALLMEIIYILERRYKLDVFR